MEKLIVKNFGPIKEAEIDLTKYVVFIGDTSTGKSVLGKLISIFREFSNILKNKIEVINIEIELNFINELKKYNIDFNFEISSIDYYDIDVHLQVSGNKFLILKNNRNFKLRDELNDYVKSSEQGVTLSKSAIQIIYGNIGVKGKSIYFPPERCLTSLVGSSISGLWANNVAIPICFKNFAATYEVARKNQKTILFSEFGFEYTFKNDNDFVTINGSELTLNKASSGVQSLIPLLLVLKYELEGDLLKPNFSFLIEEPELNLFPIKQKKLVDYLLSKLTNTEHKLIITTHSPYILSSLDTLMLAKNTFNEHPDLKEEISAIVSEDKWIDYDEISVYEVRNDGKVYSIKNKQYRSIDANAIDGVSDIISEEFDKLTELRYAQ
jgi:AAA ATPase domain